MSDPRLGPDRAHRAGPGTVRRLVTIVCAGSVGLTGVLAAPGPVSARTKDVARTTATATATSSSAELPSGSMARVVDQIGARELWRQGVTGRGVNVAVIDTGIVPVPALTGSGKVVAAVDLSGEAGVPEAVYLDTYGHGTHIAGIIAGRDPGVDPATAAPSVDQFLGVAPDAGIVSVKVADNSGAVDVSQVIAGIEWVIEHRDELNIRVLNLSYGVNPDQSYLVDPLTHAAERAWHAGIVVVAAVGNDGKKMQTVANPALDPFVIAVGAVEWAGNGWTLPEYSSSGTRGGRIPDVAAPGSHIDSLRSPGSRNDVEHPEGYVSPSLFRGSGSSQATAVVSGAAALLLSARPGLTPDQVKWALKESAVPVAKDLFVGEGLIRVAEAAGLAVSAPAATQTWARATGSGSLEAARGGEYVTVNGSLLTGETSVTGASWTGASWTGASWTGASWTGASWTGASWRGASWTGASWTGASWSGASWTGASWTGASWTGASWTGASWTGASWTGASWTGASWTGASWTGASWTGAGWQ